jgi:hypothetical protein
MRTQVTPRWVPVVNGQPRLEYGLWEFRAQAVSAAKEIALVIGSTDTGAAKVFYRVLR